MQPSLCGSLSPKASLSISTNNFLNHLFLTDVEYNFVEVLNGRKNGRMLARLHVYAATDSKVFGEIITDISVRNQKIVRFINSILFAKFLNMKSLAT